MYFGYDFREEIMLATALHEPPVNFEARTKFDLHRIVEDQVIVDDACLLSFPQFWHSMQLLMSLIHLSADILCVLIRM